ncbi:anti-sigma factor family protein [Gryllotalpicola reticulitermitis]|uniref:Anti-sigma factor family protein n=1 Tax=Gryllotalpicola reticulitermitis TaxID=1184153 RepID=A0ABV8Q9F5_9MICO
MSAESLHEWDAAYVLGALSPEDRRTFEEHLEGCPECRASIAELAGIPALLGRLPAPRAVTGRTGETGKTGETAVGSGVMPVGRASLAQAVPAPSSASASGETLAVLAHRVRRRRLARRWLTAGTAVVAAAAIAGAVVIPMRLDAPPRPTASVALAQAEPGPLSATVDLTAKRWGTALTMTCRYDSAPSSAGPAGDAVGAGDAGDAGNAGDAGDAGSTGYADSTGRYALYVTDASGTATRVASWSAWPGATIHASGAVDLAVSQLRTLQVRDASSGEVLLSSPVR